MTKNSKSDALEWGPIREVPTAKAPPAEVGKFWALYRDLLLRLEATPAAFTLQVPLSGSVSSAQRILARLFNTRLGKGAVVVYAALERDGKQYLYVRRGPQWKQTKVEDSD